MLASSPDHRVQRITLGCLGYAAAAVLLGVSALMNFKFGQSLGRTAEDGYIYGAASVASDCFKALAPFFFFAAIRTRTWSQAVASAVVWVVCMSFSMVSATGHAALNRMDSTGNRAAQATSYKDLRADLARAEQEIAGVPQHRPAATIAAEIEAQKTQRTYQLTGACASPANATQRGFCTNLHKLEAEKGSADATGAILARIAAIKAKMETNSGAVLAEADPQAGVLAKLTGFKLDQVQLGLMLFVVLLLEVGSSFGFYTAAAMFCGSPNGGLKMGKPEDAAQPEEPEVVANDNGKVISLAAAKSRMRPPDHPLHYAAARDALVGHLEANGSIMARELEEGFGRPRQTVARWLGQFEQRGLIVQTKTNAGVEVRLAERNGAGADIRAAA